jgi:hypothetical protein
VGGTDWQPAKAAAISMAKAPRRAGDEGCSKPCLLLIRMNIKLFSSFNV